MRHDLRQEPSAGMPHVRICAGGAGQPAFLPQPLLLHGPIEHWQVAGLPIAPVMDAFHRLTAARAKGGHSLPWSQLHDQPPLLTALLMLPI